jgi:hypothetical protein
MDMGVQQRPIGVSNRASPRGFMACCIGYAPSDVGNEERT